MKIVVCGSLDFTEQIKSVADQLTARGDEVTIPRGAEAILKGELTFGQVKKERESLDVPQSKVKNNVLKYYFEKIQSSDAILVLNFEKNGIPNYIGGNTLIEMAFAHVLDKTIYLFNPIPQMSYSSEILATLPVVIHGDVSLITNVLS